MAKMIFEIDKSLDERFRHVIATTKGLHKGVIRESIVEAVLEWTKKREEEIRKKENSSKQ